MNQLPIVIINGKAYYSDVRLEEFRAVSNPHDRITFAQVDNDTEGKYEFSEE